MSTATEPMVMPIDSDPTRGDKPRPVPRAILRVVVADDVGSVSVGNHVLATGREHFIEVYADQVKDIEAQVRTAKHRQAIETAKEMAENQMREVIAKELKGFRGTDLERRAQEDKLRKTVAIHWACELKRLGFPHGVPALISCEKVSDKEMPITPETAQLSANENLAELVRTLLRTVKAEQRDPNRKS